LPGSRALRFGYAPYRHAWVKTVALNGRSITGRASAKGKRTLHFPVGGATPGVRIMIAVHVSHHGRKGTCQASFRPKSAPAPSVAPTQSPASPSPSPAPTTAPPTPKPPAASCYPLSNGGNCYEPGEFCRASDHGVSGVAGDDEKIVCENTNGWRWEPA
jgi:hypothetical protein